MAAERPEFSYSEQRKELGIVGGGGCSYAGAGQYHQDRGEGCIFGQAFARLGYSRDEVKSLDGHPVIELAEVGVLAGVGVDDLTWANMVQGHQDSGDTWGYSVGLADACLKRGNYTEEYITP